MEIEGEGAISNKDHCVCTVEVEGAISNKDHCECTMEVEGSHEYWTSVCVKNKILNWPRKYV